MWSWNLCFEHLSGKFRLLYTFASSYSCFQVTILCPLDPRVEPWSGYTLKDFRIKSSHNVSSNPRTFSLIHWLNIPRCGFLVLHVKVEIYQALNSSHTRLASWCVVSSYSWFINICPRIYLALLTVLGWFDSNRTFFVVCYICRWSGLIPRKSL